MVALTKRQKANLEVAEQKSLRSSLGAPGWTRRERPQKIFMGVVKEDLLIGVTEEDVVVGVRWRQIILWRPQRDELEKEEKTHK